MSQTSPLALPDVLQEESRALRPEAAAGQAPAPLSALCLSGGGIRSATFALGIIQGLADEGLLAGFDYLSTVSGGGYIGSWLTSWKQRLNGIDNVIPRLRCDAPAVPPTEADPVEHLRQYNNYLSPKVGLLSVDTWTLAATVIRNMLLNWLVFVPLLMAVLMAPRLLLSLARLGETFRQFYGDSPWVSSGHLALILPVVSAFFFAMTVYNILRYLPGVGGVNHSESDFLKYCLLPLLISAAAFITNDSWFTGGDVTLAGVTYSEILQPEWLIGGVMASAFVGWLAFLCVHGRRVPEVAQLLAPVSIAVLLASLGAGASAWYLLNDVYPNVNWAVYVTVALPFMLAALALAACLFVGLASRALKDEAREWMSRAAAWVLLFIVSWAAACTVVLLLPAWAFHLPTWGRTVLASIGGAAGWSSALAGKSAQTDAANQNDSAVAGTKPSPLLSLAAKLAAPVFATAFLVSLAMLTNWILATTHSGALSVWSEKAESFKLRGCGDCTWWDHHALLEGTRWESNLMLGVGFFALAWLMARYINTNTFSLQQMYRSRLVRAYLGASNPAPDANSFTGFSRTDDFRMHALDPRLKPFHVVNVTLNLVGTKRLEWQQRKAESFTITPLHCGSASLGYRPSGQYGGRHGISLGTAIATSGAAASPAMGYHSSTVIAFIMTLFNARLGCWLGNPGTAGENTWSDAGPRSALGSIVAEAAGLTNDNHPYVYLSDGGHFENLGIYEMVRRRCRYIVVSDGGCDPKFTYEDLGNALRKIRIDMRVPVDFDQASFQGLCDKGQRYALARIRYSLADSGGEDGYLLYIKPVMRGGEPPDVMSYRADHPAFPHQSTADQFFDESQTESYRMLGLHTANEICAGWDKTGGLPALFEFLMRGPVGQSAAAGRG